MYKTKQMHSKSSYDFVTYDPVKNRLSELQTEAKLSQSQSIVIGLFFHFYF